jgi:hypothetical protein
MSERYRSRADERAVREMNGYRDRGGGNKKWLLGLVAVCLLLGSALVYGVFFADKHDGELPLGLDAIKITRTCDFVTIEGQTYEWCYDGVMGKFERLDQNPLTGTQRSNE